MRVYRIERQKYLTDTLKGLGAALSTGFRWNSLHTRLVYSAESRSLAMLEVLVHLDLLEDLPSDRQLVVIDVPEEVSILTLTLADLPPNWHAKPPMRQTQLLGDAFVREQKAAILKVPSSIVADEFNYLINPLHPQSALMKVVESRPLVLDGRLHLAKS
jgi:RES domain-containing protein